MVSVSAALCSLVWQTRSQKSMFASLQTFSNFVNTRSWDPHLRDEVEDKRNLIPHHIHHTRYIFYLYICAVKCFMPLVQNTVQQRSYSGCLCQESVQLASKSGKVEAGHKGALSNLHACAVGVQAR